MKITKNEMGYEEMRIPLSREDETQYAEAYNVSRDIFGYGGDMQDWHNAGDQWKEIEDIFVEKTEINIIFKEV